MKLIKILVVFINIIFNDYFEKELKVIYVNMYICVRKIVNIKVLNRLVLDFCVYKVKDNRYSFLLK